VGIVLGHSLKGAGIQLGISNNLESVTARYMDVRLERKKEVLSAYHNVLHPQTKADDKDKSKSPKKKKEGIELRGRVFCYKPS
jgi:integrase